MAYFVVKMGKKMNPTFRKRHKTIWLVLALLLPFLFVMAYLAIPPKKSFSASDYLFSKEELGEIVNSEDLGYIQFNLREATQNRRQLEVIVKKPLTEPSNKVVLRGIEHGDYYVRDVLGSQGTYRFNWRDTIETEYQVQLIDQLRKKELERFVIALSKEGK